MNFTGNSEEAAQARPSPAHLPLSAPVAASVLPVPGLNVHPREPGDKAVPHHPEPHRPEPGPPASGPAGAVSAMAAPTPERAPRSDRRRADRGKGSDRPGSPPDDPQRAPLREQLDAMRVRAAQASSWLETSVHYARLVNREGVVPVTAKFTRDDIEFLGRAREEVLGFAELGLRLLELHSPLDAGGISTDPTSPILRCRSCMWRWPCPTFRMLTDALSHLPHPGSPGR
ncbi:MAG TPA: hypothetical protein VGH27_14385 [Streptosporangiaceae bacterium]|jgi:hypothetical protein